MIGATRARAAAEIARMGDLTRDIARLQTDASTMKRIQVASDDPAAAARVAELRRAQANEAQWALNVEAGSAVAARVDTTLETTATQVDRARELLVRANTATTSPADRAAIAAELAGIADDLDELTAATDSRGRPLFPATTPLRLPIADGVTVAATLSRDAAFGDLLTSIRAAAATVAAGDPDAMSAALAEVEAGADALSQTRAEQGVRAARLDAARDALAASKLDNEDERTTLEGADLAATVATLQAKMLTLSAAQSIFAKLNSKSLFDLI